MAQTTNPAAGGTLIPQQGTFRFGAVGTLIAGLAVIGAIALGSYAIASQADTTMQPRPYTESFDGWLPSVLAAREASRLENQAFDGWSKVLVPQQYETFDGWSKVLVPQQYETFDGWSKVLIPEQYETFDGWSKVLGGD